MDAGMKAIASLQRDSLASNRRSRPAPAGGSNFVFPGHPYAANAMSPPSSPLRHVSYGPEHNSAARESIGLAMTTRDSEDEQQSGTPFVSTSSPNPTAVPLPLSPPPLHELSLSDHPLPSPPPQQSYTLPPHRPASDFYVVLPRPSSQPPQAFHLQPAPAPRSSPPLRFKEPVYAMEEEEKWNGGYEVHSIPPEEEKETKKSKKRLVWALVALLVVVAVGVGVGLGISKAKSRPSEVAAEAVVSSESSSGLDFSTISAEATSIPSTSTLASITRSIASSRSSSVLLTSSELASSLSSTRPRSLSITTSIDEESTILSSRRASSTSTSSSTPTRTVASSTSPSAVLCTIPIVGLPNGATTVTLPAGVSCPTGRVTRSSSRDVEQDEEEEEENERGRDRREVIQRHRRLRRVQGM